MKGMLTGPVTILIWSFVSDDQPRSLSCYQLALVMREEVLDLEKAGVRVKSWREATADRESLATTCSACESKRNTWLPKLALLLALSKPRAQTEHSEAMPQALRLNVQPSTTIRSY